MAVLVLLPDPHGHGSLRPTSVPGARTSARAGPGGVGVCLLRAPGRNRVVILPTFLGASGSSTFCSSARSGICTVIRILVTSVVDQFEHQREQLDASFLYSWVGVVWA